jgi:hypothetical protein
MLGRAAGEGPLSLGMREVNELVGSFLLILCRVKSCGFGGESIKGHVGAYLCEGD